MALLQYWPDDRTQVFCDEKSNGKAIIETLEKIKYSNTKWSVMIGPEGGFSDTERDLILQNKNVVPVSLGNTILRSDTAITVAFYCLKEITS